MRSINLIIVHCSATVEGRDYTVADIDRWHRQRGWKSIGYHYVIYRDGTTHKGRDESQVGAHCQGHNAHSIGICYIGGLDIHGKPKDTRTPQQKAAIQALLTTLHQRYPAARICAHHDLDPHKSCPCYNVNDEPKMNNEPKDE